jgi:hypothetical protein
MLPNYTDLEFHDDDDDAEKFSVSPGLQQVLLDAMNYAPRLGDDALNICEVATRYMKSSENNRQSPPVPILIKIFAEENSHKINHGHAYTEFVKMAKMNASECDFQHTNLVWKRNMQMLYEQLAKDALAALTIQVQQENNDLIDKWCATNSQELAKVQEILGVYPLQSCELKKLLKHTRDIAALKDKYAKLREKRLKKSARQMQDPRLKESLSDPSAHSVTPGLQAHAAGMPGANVCVYTLPLENEPAKPQNTALDGSRGYPRTYQIHGELERTFKSLADIPENLEMKCTVPLNLAQSRVAPKCSQQ